MYIFFFFWKGFTFKTFGSSFSLTSHVFSKLCWLHFQDIFIVLPLLTISTATVVQATVISCLAYCKRLLTVFFASVLPSCGLVDTINM